MWEVLIYTPQTLQGEQHTVRPLMIDLLPAIQSNSFTAEACPRAITPCDRSEGLKPERLGNLDHLVGCRMES